jgi:hypothetical protein
VSGQAGRDWLAALPAQLAAQRAVIATLLEFCEATRPVTSFSVGCSLGRGAGDALSDIDAAIGVAGAADVGDVESLVAATLGASSRPGLVDLLRFQNRNDDGVRRIFAQFADRTQLDLAIAAQSGIQLGRRPDFVELYDRAAADPGADPQDAGEAASAYAVSGEQVREWAFHGWIELLDIDKYLRRGSLWEAHERLHQVRHHVWMLWAAATGALYPWHGLSQVLDNDPGDLPPGIEATVASLDAADLRRAARVSATLLAEASAAAARAHPADLPQAMARYVTSELARGAPLGQ